MTKVWAHRELEVTSRAAGMRVDRFLAARFPDRSRTSFARALRAGEVRDATGQTLRASTTLRGDEVLHLYIPGLAPAGAPPPLPPVLYEDDRVIVLNKPPGMMAHPAGTEFAWAVIGLAREAWPDDAIDLVHRLDQDTSGAIVLSKDLEANRALKGALLTGRVRKHYLAICRGITDWDSRELTGSIGAADGIIRIQMAVRPDGLPARTDVEVLGRQACGLSLVRCRLHTGRTHQIRVHLAHAGLPILGDRMYGVPPDVFLDTRSTGALSEAHLSLVGAPRQALHAAEVCFPHPDGGERVVQAPLLEDMTRWWDDPGSLPWAGLAG
jgi:23S rRNA pseudouridine1911/1915/1917 synthase